jgi:hypothetical protein
MLLILQAPAGALAADISRVGPVNMGVSVPLIQTTLLPLQIPSLSVGAPLLTPSLTPSVTLAAQATTPAALAQPAALAASSILPAARLIQGARAPEMAPGVAGLAAGMAGQVAKMIEAAGPLSDASGGDARGLGAKLQDVLGGDKGRALPPASEGPAQGAAGSGAASQQHPSGLEHAATPLQKMMLRTLDQVAAVYTEHYAPIEWKQRQMGVDLKKEYHQAREKILATPDITQRQFQAILARFVAATRDYHASIQFAATEKATLPITIVSAEGKYYLGYINREALPEAAFPFQVGDEVVEFGGKPVAQAVAALSEVPNTAQTDARLAEMHLTGRSRRSASEVPQGDVVLKIKSADGAVKDATLTWKYTAEAVPQDVPVRDGGVGTETADGSDWHLPDFQAAAKAAFRKVLSKLIPSMAHPRSGEFASLASDNAENGFALGGKNSFVPALGQIVWQLPPQVAERMPFKAYIYKNEQGQNIGYIRVSDFSGDEQAAALFAKLIQVFEKKTDGLVIDQVNNPGGSLFYMYALLSMLTSKPLNVPTHRMIVDENDAVWAADALQQLADGGTHDAEESVLAESMDGMDADEKETMSGMKRYAEFILSELKAGRRLTEPTALFGISQIAPHSQVRYTKPLVVLVNELDFSCADFFPAILQDNKRAVIFGVRTSGAGGAVKSMEIPNQQGIAGVHYTWTFAQRPGGWPIENLGVTPDAAYEITAQDLKQGFSGYAKALNGVLAKLLVGVPARVEDPKPAPVSAPKAVWTQAHAVLAAHGKDVDPAAAADLISGLGLTEGSVLKSVERVVDGEKHTLISYGTPQAAEGYLLLSENAAQTRIFWVSPEGEAVMAAQTGADGEIHETPVAAVAAAFQKEAAFWGSEPKPGEPPAPANGPTPGSSAFSPFSAWLASAIKAIRDRIR